MNDLRGCLLLLLGSVLWFVTWGLCLQSESPFLMLFLIILVLVVLSGIGITIYLLIINYKEKREKKAKLQRNTNVCERIKKKYPNAYSEEVKRCRISGELLYDHLANIPEYKWGDQEKRITKMNLVKKLAAIDTEFEKKHNELYEKSLAISSGLNNCHYPIEWSRNNSDGQITNNTLLINQFFFSIGCLNADLDYSLVPNFYLDESKFDRIKNHRLLWPDSAYSLLYKFIEKLAIQCNDNIALIYNYNKSGWDTNKIFQYYCPITNHFSNNPSKDFSIQRIDWKSDDLELPSDCKYAVIVDVCTEYEELINKCSYLIYEYRIPLIYFSFQKIWTTTEMQSFINEKEEERRKVLEKQEEERRIKEEEKKELERQKEEKRKRKIEEEKQKYLEEVDALCRALRPNVNYEEKKAENEQRIIDTICNNPILNGWSKLDSGLPYWHMLDYYPTTCDFEATEEMWNDRYTVWNFKNDTSKITPAWHDRSMNYVAGSVSSKLMEAYKSEQLKRMTLVCIPASTTESNNARYSDFSKILCENTGMVNAFSRINITKDAKPKRLGGDGVCSLEFDKDFFKGKYIVLFDDVVTSGNSMLRFKKQLEIFGAKVICAISIGKTKHTL